VNIDLKNNLIMALVGAILASGGFLAKDYFETEGEKEKFAFQLHKKLYDEGAIWRADELAAPSPQRGRSELRYGSASYARILDIVDRKV